MTKKSMCEELKSYAILDGGEWGEAMMALCHVHHYTTYFSKEIVDAINKEISDNLDYAKKHATIVEESETHITKYKSLDWHE